MWFFIAVFVVALVVSFAMTPKPQTQKPAGINEVNVPTAEEGREIPVIFGTMLIEDINIVDHRNLRTVAIRKKGGKK